MKSKIAKALLIGVGCALLACPGPGRPFPALDEDAGIETEDAGVVKDAGRRSAIGGPCESASDCVNVAGGTDCMTEAEAALLGLSAPGGYCTSETCPLPNSCGLAGVCGTLGLEEGLPRCEAACGSDNDCRDGYHCLSHGCVPGRLDAGVSLDGGFDPDGGWDSDAGPQDGGSVGFPDAGIPTSWMGRQYMNDLNLYGAADSFPTLSQDGLKICFASNRSGGVGSIDIWCAKRASPTAPFDPPVNQSTLNTSSYDTSPWLVGNEIFFASSRSGNYRLYRATWSDEVEAFINPEPLAELNSGNEDLTPTLSPDGLQIFWTSIRTGSLGRDLYRSSRTAVGQMFNAPTPISALNTSGDERAPSPAPDLSYMLFTSTGIGSSGLTPYLARASGATWNSPATVDAYTANQTVESLRVGPDGWLYGSQTNSDGYTDLVRFPPRAYEDPGAPCGPVSGVWTYAANGPCLGHGGGRPDHDGWSISLGQTQLNQLIHGPATTAIPAGTRTATYRLMIDNTALPDDNIAYVSVYSENGEMAGLAVHRNLFHQSFTYQDFNVSFTNVSGRHLEFRVYWYGTAYLRVKQISVQ